MMLKWNFSISLGKLLEENIYLPGSRTDKIGGARLRKHLL